MRILPAIDIIDGKCVRLTQGDYSRKKVYNESPLEVARQLEAAGMRYLHLVDLDGAKAGKVTNWVVVKDICSKTNLHVDFGGGVKTGEEMSKLFDLGVRQVNLGSIAVKNPTLVYEWIDTFGTEKIILSADVKDETIAISGWQESSSLHIVNFIEDYMSHQLTYVTCTDISTDGMLTGPNIDLYKKLLSKFKDLKLVASGGVSALQDVLALKEIGVDGVIIGKAIYEGRVNVQDLAKL